MRESVQNSVRAAALLCAASFVVSLVLAGPAVGQDDYPPDAPAPESIQVQPDLPRSGIDADTDRPTRGSGRPTADTGSGPGSTGSTPGTGTGANPASPKGPTASNPPRGDSSTPIALWVVLVSVAALLALGLTLYRRVLSR
jgi:hypothetical protein